MKAAVLFTLTGLILLSFLGLQVLDWTPQDILMSFFASNATCFLDLFITLEIQRYGLLRGGLKSWSFFIALGCSLLALFSPALRNPVHLAIQLIPLMLCGGPGILIWGELQDKLVAHRQRKAAQQ